MKNFTSETHQFSIWNKQYSENIYCGLGKLFSLTTQTNRKYLPEASKHKKKHTSWKKMIAKDHIVVLQLTNQLSCNSFDTQQIHTSAVP